LNYSVLELKQRFSVSSFTHERRDDCTTRCIAESSIITPLR
jgi:hypothetical protein